MRRIVGREAVRRDVEATQRAATSAPRPGIERSHLFRVLDQEFEAIAARRPERSRWDAVLRWLDQHRIRDRHGEPVTAGLLAVTWREVRVAREARPLGHADHGNGTESGSDTEARPGEEILIMQENGMSTTRRASFGGEFANALEAADRRSPLYLFMRENFDEICTHRPKHGGWHKFLAVVNDNGILDGQGNPVSMRVLWRTWEKVKKTVLTERNRPAARLSPEPVTHLRPDPQARPVREPFASSGPRNEPMPAPFTSFQPQTRSSAAWANPLSDDPADEPPPVLNLEQAWHVQRLRNGLLVQAGRRPTTTLDNDLVNYLDQESLRVFIEGRSTPGIGLARHEDMYVN